MSSVYSMWGRNNICISSLVHRLLYLACYNLLGKALYLYEEKRLSVRSLGCCPSSLNYGEEVWFLRSHRSGAPGYMAPPTPV